MAETVFGWVALTVATIGLLVIIYKHLHGAQQFGRWAGGGRVTLAGAVSGCVFIGCIGTAALQHTAIWLIPGVSAWLFGYLSQNRANRRHYTEEEQLRKTNALDHPGVFDDPPPTNMDAAPGCLLDLFDAGACTYLGVVSKADMKATFASFAESPDQGVNDLFIIQESVDFLPHFSVSQEYLELLKIALLQRDYLVLRWMPQSGSSEELGE